MPHRRQVKHPSLSPPLTGGARGGCGISPHAVFHPHLASPIKGEEWHYVYVIYLNLTRMGQCPPTEIANKSECYGG